MVRKTMAQNFHKEPRRPLMVHVARVQAYNGFRAPASPKRSRPFLCPTGPDHFIRSHVGERAAMESGLLTDPRLAAFTLASKQYHLGDQSI